MRFKEYINEMKMKWALTKNNAYEKFLYDDPSLTLMTLSTKKIMKDVNDIAIQPDGTNAKKVRLERLEQHIKDGGYLDPPVIGYNEYTNKISFGNGRHRFYWAWTHNIDKIPFFVDSEKAEIIKKKYS